MVRVRVVGVYPAIEWSPQPKAVFQFEIFVPVIPNDGLAVHKGSVSIRGSVVVSAVFACNAKGTNKSWLTPVMV